MSRAAPPAVGVVGASARAAVHSLARAGFAAWAVDLFADRDLTRVAPTAVCPIDAYPAALPDLAKQFPPGPVLYTGGLENDPDIVRALARDRTLWGNPPDVLERVRDPYSLRELLTANGFASPRLLAPGSSCLEEGQWLVKSRRSSGGLGVRRARRGEVPRRGSYLQEVVAGRAMSALFVADHPRCDFVGATEQLIGTPWLHARGFQYAGTIGPIDLGAGLESELRGIGYRLLTEVGVRGIFGIDFILNENRATVIEVNPRYTAAVEVLEHATSTSVYTNPRATPQSEARRNIAKAVYYAAQAIAFPHDGPWGVDLAGAFDAWRLPGYADIPAPDAIIEPGQPVLTIFAAGSSTADCRDRLQSRAAELDRHFARATP